MSHISNITDAAMAIIVASIVLGGANKAWSIITAKAARTPTRIKGLIFGLIFDFLLISACLFMIFFLYWSDAPSTKRDIFGGCLLSIAASVSVLFTAIDVFLLRMALTIERAARKIA